jgi:hypothetical protein
VVEVSARGIEEFLGARQVFAVNFRVASARLGEKIFESDVGSSLPARAAPV